MPLLTQLRLITPEAHCFVRSIDLFNAELSPAEVPGGLRRGEHSQQRETETERDSATDKQTDRESATKTKGQVDRRIYKTDNEKPAEDQRQTLRERRGEGYSNSNSKTLSYKDWRERERKRERERERERDRQTHRHTDTQTHRHREREHSDTQLH